MDELDIFAKMAQWPDETCFAIVADEGQEGDLMLLREDAQEMIDAQAIAAVRRIGQSTCQKQNPHGSPNGTVGTRISRKVRVALRTCLTV